jgi:hypothetical protein
LWLLTRVIAAINFRCCSKSRFSNASGNQYSSVSSYSISWGIRLVNLPE